MPTNPSRLRFREYRQEVRERNAKKERPQLRGNHDRSPKKLGDRERSFGELLKAFWQLIAAHRPAVISAMILLTIGIVLRLIPPLGTKLAIDSVLTTPPKPLPTWMDSLPFPAGPMDRLIAISLVVTVITLSLIHI